jgi:putative holliday junction resolvase
MAISQPAPTSTMPSSTWCDAPARTPQRRAARMSRVLAIDYGERRIGLALSDPTRTIAQPLDTLVRRAGKRPPIAAIVDIVASRDVAHIVVGLPLTLEGGESAWTREVRDFAARVAERTGVSVSLADERMTSVLATRAVRSLGLPRGERQRKERVDAAAAAVILQAFLDGERSKRLQESDEQKDS